jgi:hypothetical protein
VQVVLMAIVFYTFALISVDRYAAFMSPSHYERTVVNIK